MTSPQIVWETPPDTYRRTKWAPVLEQVMRRPGQWARIATKNGGEKASGLAGSLKRQETRRPSGRWEFMSRRLDDTTWGVYARYLGE